MFPFVYVWCVKRRGDDCIGKKTKESRNIGEKERRKIETEIERYSKRGTESERWGIKNRRRKCRENREKRQI